jgi:hypothetical protein
MPFANGESHHGIANSCRLTDTSMSRIPVGKANDATGITGQKFPEAHLSLLFNLADLSLIQSS